MTATAKRWWPIWVALAVVGGVIGWRAPEVGFWPTVGLLVLAAVVACAVDWPRLWERDR